MELPIEKVPTPDSRKTGLRRSRQTVNTKKYKKVLALVCRVFSSPRPKIHGNLSWSKSTGFSTTTETVSSPVFKEIADNTIHGISNFTLPWEEKGLGGVFPSIRSRKQRSYMLIHTLVFLIIPATKKTGLNLQNMQLRSCGGRIPWWKTMFLISWNDLPRTRFIYWRNLVCAWFTRAREGWQSIHFLQLQKYQEA